MASYADSLHHSLLDALCASYRYCQKQSALGVSFVVSTVFLLKTLGPMVMHRKQVSSTIQLLDHTIVWYCVIRNM
jgi:hypothetical protein